MVSKVTPPEVQETSVSHSTPDEQDERTVEECRTWLGRRTMEMNVTVTYKFEDRAIHQQTTEAISAVYALQNRDNYAGTPERAASMKSKLISIFKDDAVVGFVDEYSDDLEGLEDMTTEEDGTTRLDFVCGSTGDMFADALSNWLRNLGADDVDSKCIADYQVDGDEGDYSEDDSLEAESSTQGDYEVENTLVSDHAGFEALKSLRADTLSEALKLITKESFAGINFSNFRKLFSLNAEITETISPSCWIHLYFDSELTIQCEFDMEEDQKAVDVGFDDIASFALRCGLATKDRIEKINESEGYRYGVLFQSFGSEADIEMDVTHLTTDEAIVRVCIAINADA